MSTLRRLLHPLLCPLHDLLFVHNIYGDEILYTGKRSWWECSRCRARVGKLELYMGIENEEEST